MMARTQITLDPELQRRARQRAGDLGVSLAEYVRTLVARDIGNRTPQPNPSLVCDLGRSKSSNIAGNKDSMIANAFAASRKRPAKS
ncbi:MAG: hypothetical protein HYZ37_06610 [Candidatus Solibacter usitatus]|nr:hypothetical protein [Candidatus Solibacter usitatus]